MVKLTEQDRKLLAVLSHNNRDIFDLGDESVVSHDATFHRLQHLSTNGFVDWMYPEDEVCITDAGRAALQEAE